MTYFTRVQINPTRREARKLLLHPEALHAAVLSAFPPDVDQSSRILYRLDGKGHEYTLYIVSPEAPDASNLIEQAGWATRPAQTADYSKLLSSLMKGQEWAFEILANPTVSVKTEHGKRGKVVPLASVPSQLEWLANKGADNGFEVLHSDVYERKDLSFYKEAGKRRVNLRTARFRGVLRVTDAERFRATLIDGLGRARAYGCGLITLAKVDSAR